MKRRSLLALGAGLGLLAATNALAQRSWDQPVGPTVVDRGSPHYRFTSFKLASADEARRYWIQVGIPTRPAPAGGYPVIYMVDGNAAMASIDEAVLAELDGLSPPVLVAVGYDTPARIDVMSRAYDYTPPVVRDGQPIAPVVRGRPGGGAEQYLTLIEQQVKPKVEALAPIDRTRQTLWGHSYGGLFTLYALTAHPDFYRSYAAGDPSIWWHDGVLAEPLLQTAAGSLSGKRVRVMVGGGRPASATQTAAPVRQPQPQPQPQPQTNRPPDTATGVRPPPEIARTVVEVLNRAGADAEYRVFPGLGHGDMLKASLIPALRLAAQP